MKQTFTIGELAKSVGVNVETIRYYERRGLVDRPPRPARGYRRYPAATLERLIFIRRAQALGFTLDEIATLLSLGEGSCRDVQALAEGKLAGVRAKIAGLRRLETVLDELVDQCRSNPESAHCPIVESLLPGEESH